MEITSYGKFNFTTEQSLRQALMPSRVARGGGGKITSAVLWGTKQVKNHGEQLLYLVKRERDHGNVTNLAAFGATILGL